MSDTTRNLVRVEPHKHRYRVTRVYTTPEEIAQAKAHAANGDDWIGTAIKPGRLVHRGWRQWDGAEPLEVGDEVTGIAILRWPGAFRVP